MRNSSVLRWAYVLALIVSDFVMLRLAFVLAYRLRLVGEPRVGQPSDPPATFDDLALLSVAVIMVVFAIRRLYIPRRGFGRVDLLYQISAAVALGWLAALAAILLVYRTLDPPRLMLVYWALLSIALVWLTRVVLDALLRDAHRNGRDLERVLIVGDGEQAELIEAKIRASPELGYQVVGFIGTQQPVDSRSTCAGRSVQHPGSRAAARGGRGDHRLAGRYESPAAGRDRDELHAPARRHQDLPGHLRADGARGRDQRADGLAVDARARRGAARLDALPQTRARRRRELVGARAAVAVLPAHGDCWSS